MLFLINNPFLPSLSHLYVSLNLLFNQLLSLSAWECSFLLLYLDLVISPTSPLRFVNYKASYTVICYSHPFALHHFYTSPICPHLEYCFFLWDCQSSNLSSRLEKIQFFACKLCCNRWSSNFPTLLSKLHLSSLSSHCCKKYLFLQASS